MPYNNSSVCTDETDELWTYLFAGCGFRSCCDGLRLGEVVSYTGCNTSTYTRYAGLL